MTSGRIVCAPDAPAAEIEGDVRGPERAIEARDFFVDPFRRDGEGRLQILPLEQIQAAFDRDSRRRSEEVVVFSLLDDARIVYLWRRSLYRGEL